MNKDLEKKFVEEGADIEHDRWARWQEWCHKVLRENCPSPKLEKVLERWDRQIATKYTDLSEEEKESDRTETRNYLPLIDKHFIAKEEHYPLHQVNEKGEITSLYTKQEVLDMIGEDAEKSGFHEKDCGMLCVCYSYNQAKQEIRERFQNDS